MPARSIVVFRANPFVGLTRVVQPQIVIDRLWRKNGRQPLRQRLKTIERAVTTDRDETVDSKPVQPIANLIEVGFL